MKTIFLSAVIPLVLLVASSSGIWHCIKVADKCAPTTTEPQSYVPDSPETQYITYLFKAPWNGAVDIEYENKTIHLRYCEKSQLIHEPGAGPLNITVILPQSRDSRHATFESKPNQNWIVGTKGVYKQTKSADDANEQLRDPDFPFKCGWRCSGL